MKISIITASYNYEDYICETIESIIAQTYPHFELIIVDDGSVDGSLEVIRQYCQKDSRIKLFQHKGGVNKGLRETLKLGLKMAQNDWVAFLESDDIWTCDYLQEKVNIINKYPDIGLVFNDVDMFGDSKTVEYYNPHFETVRPILAQKTNPSSYYGCLEDMNLISTFSTAMVKKNDLLECDFNSPIQPYLDFYLWLQLSGKKDFYYVDKKLTKWRMHKNSYISAAKNEKLLNEIQFEVKKRKLSGKSFSLKDFLLLFKKIRRALLRIHFKHKKIYFFGKWYEIQSV